MDSLVSMKAIYKQYRTVAALSDVTLTIEQGGFYALIGENGAGKSTLIRIITGLSRQTSGTLELFGQTSRRLVNRARSHIGYMPDASGSWQELSAYDNLAVRCVEWGIKQENSINEILDLVGLSSAGNKAIKTFSLGMKRRLDLAVALLGNPDLLVLDEPINGLDPLGIVEMRKLLQYLHSEQNKTLIVSSHNLEELYKTADHYVLMGHGRIIETISSEQFEQMRRTSLVLRVSDVHKARRVLVNYVKVDQIHRNGEHELKVTAFSDKTAQLVADLLAHNVSLSEVYFERQSLEDYYCSLVLGDVRHAA